MPGVYVALSSEVWPEFQEYERASTTLISAYVGPMLADYVAAPAPGTARGRGRMQLADHAIQRRA